MDEYRDIFDQRGGSYHAAMQRYPDARNREFLALFDDVPMGRVRRLLDIPAGGGYLRRLLPGHIEVTEVEPSAGFHAGAAEPGSIPRRPSGEQFDCITCLAAMHHIHPPEPYLADLCRALAPGGCLVVGDVAAGSPQARFLDEFVGRHNGTGHAGHYLPTCRDALEQLVPSTEIRLVSAEIRPCPWRFSTRKQLIEFVRLLFGLQGIDEQAIGDALTARIGIDSGEDWVALDWQLQYLTWIRSPASAE